jgi:hypothetical protein
LYTSFPSDNFFYKPHVCATIQDNGIGKFKRKTERKVVFMEEKMEKGRNRVSSGESRQQVAKSVGTNERILRQQLKAARTCKNSVLFLTL